MIESAEYNMLLLTSWILLVKKSNPEILIQFFYFSEQLFILVFVVDADHVSAVQNARAESIVKLKIISGCKFVTMFWD